MKTCAETRQDLWNLYQLVEVAETDAKQARCAVTKITALDWINGAWVPRLMHFVALADTGVSAEARNAGFDKIW